MQYLHGKCGICSCSGVAFEIWISRRKSEVERRPRPGCRFHPDSPAMPLDGLLTEGESESGPGVFFSMQTLEDAKNAVVERPIYARTIVFDRKYAFQILTPERNVDARIGCATVFHGISD